MLHLIEVFKAGTHVAASGERISFSEKDVRSIAENYDPALHKAPLVVGHPSDNAPAYGRAVSFGIVGGKLFASCDEVDASFAELVNAKRFPKVSLSLYKPDSPANPKPGAYYPRHIGFLGAMPPAVKGLADASFAGKAEDFISVALSFSEGDGTPPVPAPPDASGAPADGAAKPPPQPTEAEKAMLESVGKAFPDLDDATKAKIAKILAEAQKKPVDPQAALNHAELERGRAEIRAGHAKLRRERNTDFLNGLRAKGVMLPVSEAATLSFMDLLHPESSRDVVSFGEGEKRTPDAIFREDFLARIPPQVSFAEVAGSAGESTEDSTGVSRRATAYQAEQRAKGVHVSTTQAVEHVMKNT